LTLLKATSQSWTGGHPGTGSGTYYCIYLIPNRNSKKIVIDSIWMKDKGYKFDKFIVKNKITNEFKKKDTIILKFNDYKPGEYNNPVYYENMDTTIKIITPPFEYKGEALLRYFSNSISKYIIIEKFEILEPLAFP